MNSHAIPDSFHEPLSAVQRLLNRFAEQGIVIGGIAASLLGEPRATADIDAVIVLSVDDLPLLIAAAKEEGLTPRITDAETFARRNRVLLLNHTASGINVDISLGLLPFEVEAAERGQIYQAGSLKIRLPTPEDLIIQKAIAHRPKDLTDIAAIIANHPNLDWQRIQSWLEQFSELLEMPEVWQNIAKLRPKGKRRK